jgi:hypothetical protein
MLSPLIRRATTNDDPRRKQRGVTIALVAASMVAIIAMAALSIDIGTLYQAKAQAQRAADAAALAAARVISISGITGDPANGATDGNWNLICGPAGTATLAATAIAQVQANFVGGLAIPGSQITVTYGGGSAGGSSADCTGAGQAFAVNPLVTVKVQQVNLPLFFAKVFSLVGGNFSSSSVSATATAEVFNPANWTTAGLGGSLVPVWPRCVKPWIVPDADPVQGGMFVTPTGAISSPGVSLGGVGTGVIGETFNLVADCPATGSCNPPPINPPTVNVGTAPKFNLQYLPGWVQNASPAASTCAVGDYQQAIAGCDNTSPYQCGVPSASATPPTQLDLTENPFGAVNDSATAAECLIHASGAGQALGQDLLVTTSFPFQIQAGTANPVATSGNISSSTSIVSFPIYQSGGGGGLPVGTNNPAVTVIGFLQVFINYVNADGSLNVTVLNVAGCGNLATSTSPGNVTGTSPVPIRLITPP